MGREVASFVPIVTGALFPPQVECSSELFTETSGYLSSPEYPLPYPAELRCNYSIRLDRGLAITLKFLEPFDIDDHQQVHCPYDQLKVLETSPNLCPTCHQTITNLLLPGKLSGPALLAGGSRD